MTTPFLISAPRWDAAGGVSVGKIVAFINYLQTTMGPLGIMVLMANVAAAATASAERINGVLETIPEVQDPLLPRALPDGRGIRVAFEAVDFHYNGTNDGLVLNDVDLVAEPGQMVAILGAPGAGNSSIVASLP